jgi:hypothetical protein
LSVIRRADEPRTKHGLNTDDRWSSRIRALSVPNDVQKLDGTWGDSFPEPPHISVPDFSVVIIWFG